MKYSLTSLPRDRVKATMLPAWSPKDVYFIAERAYGLYRQGRLREAAVLFEGLVIVDPENVYCRKALTAVCIGLGEHQFASPEALTTFAPHAR